MRFTGEETSALPSLEGSLPRGPIRELFPMESFISEFSVAADAADGADLSNIALLRAAWPFICSHKGRSDTRSQAKREVVEPGGEDFAHAGFHKSYRAAHFSRRCSVVAPASMVGSIIDRG